MAKPFPLSMIPRTRTRKCLSGSMLLSSAPTRAFRVPGTSRRRDDIRKLFFLSVVICCEANVCGIVLRLIIEGLFC
jgi:hypothetical protein